MAVLLAVALAWPLPLLTLLPRAALADDAAERATVHALKAQALFKSGQFHAAGDTFLQAYAIAPKPALLFNAARAYQEGRDYDLAMGLYERYLGLKDADDAGRADARVRLEACRRAKAAVPAGQTAATAPPAQVQSGQLQPVAPTAASTAAAAPPAAVPPPAQAVRLARPVEALPVPPLSHAQGWAAAANPAQDPRLVIASQDGRIDAEADVRVPVWFGLGMVLVGLPIAYSRPALPPPSRLAGQPADYTEAYTRSYQAVATARQRRLALYGGLTTVVAAVVLLAASQRVQ